MDDSIAGLLGTGSGRWDRRKENGRSSHFLRSAGRMLNEKPVRLDITMSSREILRVLWLPESSTERTAMVLQIPHRRFDSDRCLSS